MPKAMDAPDKTRRRMREELGVVGEVGSSFKLVDGSSGESYFFFRNPYTLTFRSPAWLVMIIR